MTVIKTFACYPGILSFEPTESNIDEFAESLAAAGVTHVQINHLPDAMHPEQLAQPDNVYLWYANWGPPLDLFVSSKLNCGLWPEMYLERNRRTLLRFANAARRHGMKPLLYLCEPRFVPERFFAKFPRLRGPRVDNPSFSRTPLYALCTDWPEVLHHYRQMMDQMMGLVPDLSMVTLFTSDSGAGFDFNPLTYAGPNGAGRKDIPLEERVLRWLRVILDAGLALNSDFRVNLTSGLSPEVQAKVQASAPAGIVGSVYGLYSWNGGLEEHWAYHQATWGVPRAKWTILNLDRKVAAAERFSDLKNRYDDAARGGRDPLVHAELPTTDYPRNMRYVPHPFETIKIMKNIVRLGAKGITLWGVISPRRLVPYDVNSQAMHLINENIDADPETLIAGIAERWVGRQHAMVLLDAWRRCDHAWVRRPLWAYTGLLKQHLPGPLVPDILALKPEETAYYRTIAMDDLEMIQGRGSWLPHERDERNRDFVLHEIYEKQTLPGLRDAAALLKVEADGAEGDARTVLLNQRDYIHLAYLMQRTNYNWYEAGRYLLPGPAPGHDRKINEIIDDEIANTREIIDLMIGRLEHFMRVMSSDYFTYIEVGPSFVEQLKKRVEVMLVHRGDQPRSLSDQLGKMRIFFQPLNSEVIG